MSTKEPESILFRYKPVLKYDFISEHASILASHGKVWVWKIGKPLSINIAQNVINRGGGLILKSPKKDGDKYYHCKLTGIREKKPEEDYLYPAYYQKIQISEYGPVATGFWFCIESINELMPEEIERLYLCSNNRKVVDVIKETRTVIMRVYRANNQ